VAAASEAIHARGEFVVALAGGATPRTMYARLAAPPLFAMVHWSSVQFLWGDERCVPPDDEASNYRMAREALLDHVPVAAANVHRIRGEDDPVRAAAAYEREKRRIDLVLLGLGEDGHTASLFPGAVAAHDDPRWAIAVRAPVAPAWRVTLTPVVINAAAEVAFLVAGDAKAGIVGRVLEGPRRPHELPAQLIVPTSGRVVWFLDAMAAAELRGGGG
jgi:6-phosphogluconolactonase